MAKLTYSNISYWRMSCRFLENNTVITKGASEIEKVWLSRLGEDNLQQSPQECESIVQWLLSEEKEQWAGFTLEQQKMKTQRFQYRYQILKQRYLDVSLTQAYRNLIHRLSCVIVVHYHLKDCLSANREGQRTLLEVIQAVTQEMIKNDRHLQEQMTRITKCTADEPLRNRLLFASVEEYCLPTNQNPSLFIDHFNRYIRRYRSNSNVLFLLAQSNLSLKLLDHQDVYQFSKVMLEVRYPLVSA